MIDQQILDRLAIIEQQLEQHLLFSKEILTFSEFCRFCGISESHGYKLTSGQMVPHFKPGGKMLYFRRREVEEWLLSNRVETLTTLHEQADQFSFKRPCQR